MTIKFKSITFMLWLAGWLAPTAEAATAYYVAPNGSDNGGGTFASPFRTIQKCASEATAGDTCLIRAGVYRETVVPANSGTATAKITFKPYNNENVTISGADLISSGSWSVDSGSVYKTTAAPNTGLGYNQVFVNGFMVNEARWPNSSATAAPLFLTSATVDSGCAAGGCTGIAGGAGAIGVINDSDLATGHVGAKVNVTLVADYASQTGDVTTSTNGQIKFIFNSYADYFKPEANQKYFLWGKRMYLDAPNEMFHDGTTLFLRTPSSSNPANHLVEAKAREYAFDLSGRSHIVIEGASTITTNAESQNNVIDGIEAKYVSHGINITSAGWGYGQDLFYATGIQLRGRNNALINSTIAYSSGNGVLLLGTSPTHGGHTVSNNVIHHVNYAAVDSATIQLGIPHITSGSSNHLIERNTLYNVGRSVIAHSGAKNVKILYNDMFNAGLMTTDNGITYAAHQDGQQSEIAYNLVHDNKGHTSGNGIYLDDNTSGYRVHHNVSWGSNNALHMNPPSVNHLIYNNTLIGNSYSVGSQTGNDFVGSELKNNILRNRMGNMEKIAQSHNLPETIDPRFVDALEHDYRLRSDSPAINSGTSLPPYTNGSVGVPDIGAYEFGAPPWIAGASNAAAGKLPTSTGGLCDNHSDPSYAIDGLSTTKWCSGASGAKWLQVKLGGQAYSINRWVVRHAGAGGESASLNTADFKLQKSVNGTAWVDVDTVSGNTASVTDRTLPSPVTEHRYFRLYITNAGSDGIARVYEFALYHQGAVTDTEAPTAPMGLMSPGKTATTVDLTWTASTDNVGVTGYDVYRNGALCGVSTTTSFTCSGLDAGTAYSFTVRAKDAAGNVSAASGALSVTTNAAGSANLALNKPVMASGSNCQPLQGAHLAVDGSTSTKWCYGSSDAKWLRVDLGSNSTVTRWVVRHAGSGGEQASLNTRDFKLQHSSDGVNWTDRDSVTGNTAPVTDRNVAATSNRYWRLYITNSGSDTSARINEFELY